MGLEKEENGEGELATVDCDGSDALVNSEQEKSEVRPYLHTIGSSKRWRR
jgi:hypothetical protein